MREFRSGSSRVLVTTDLLARGINVQQVSINYGLPSNRENYIHWIGRSGRFERKGVTINFIRLITHDEVRMSSSSTTEVGGEGDAQQSCWLPLNYSHMTTWSSLSALSLSLCTRKSSRSFVSSHVHSASRVFAMRSQSRRVASRACRPSS